LNEPSDGGGFPTVLAGERESFRQLRLTTNFERTQILIPWPFGVSGSDSRHSFNLTLPSAPLVVALTSRLKQSGHLMRLGLEAGLSSRLPEMEDPSLAANYR